jgi:hypothetical protein
MPQHNEQQAPAGKAKDAQASILALHAAGDDVEALVEAIHEATFLDETPGEARQKLRGAAGWVLEGGRGTVSLSRPHDACTQPRGPNWPKL